MIYTLTLNPAIDYVMFLDELKVGNINRCVNECFSYGGKGINVSLILKELGIKSVATGFVAGFTGEAIEKGIACEDIKSDFVKLKNGFTRINVKIRDGKETDINAIGPVAESLDVERLYCKLELLNKGDILVLSGSIPSSLPQDIYKKIMERLREKGVVFIVDAERDLLLSTLKYKPFLIKPNNDELGEIFSTVINSPETALKYARELKKLGAQNVLVSMGEKGAVLLDQNGNDYFAFPFSGKAVNTVGAGDSMLAGFIAGYLLKDDFNYALKLGSASGAATAFSTGLATRKQIEALLNKNTVRN